MTVLKYYYRVSSLSFPNVLDPVDPLKKQGLIVKNVLKSQSRVCLCCLLKFIFYAVEPLACENSRFSSLLAARDLLRRINVCDPATEIPY